MKFDQQLHMLWSGPKVMRMLITVDIGIKSVGSIVINAKLSSIAVAHLGTDG
jgi:hypothetical protein